MAPYSFPGDDIMVIQMSAKRNAPFGHKSASVDALGDFGAGQL
jgi:hypothetical protein